MTVDLKHIGKFINGDWVVEDLTLTVNSGECLAILGPSGCGKSTTLRLVAGLEQTDSGQIFINNREVTNVAPADRRIGMVFQSYALFPHLSVSSNLKLGLKIRGKSAKEQVKKVSYILSIMQIEHLAERLPSELSGGQRQRVALARALIRDPDVYLLDEPMSNLDAQLREELRPELKRLILDRDQPVLYVTHDQYEAMAIADRIALLNKGKLQQIGTPEDLYKNPKTIFAAGFIGRPQINFLPEINGMIKAIRPENIIFKSEGLACKIQSREWLGTHQLLYLESNLGALRILLNSETSIPERAFISWNKSDEHIFSSKDGRRIIF